MEKTITINNNEITLTNNSEWLYIYREQFGVDLIETIMPILAAAFQVVGGLVEEIGDTKNVEIKDVARIYASEAIQNAYIYLATARITDAINIAWAMAKAADNSTKPPRNWVRDLGDFPTDVIIPAIIELILNEFVSSKNLDRLQEMARNLQPKK